jgi:phenylalanyl-tRNA synthetase alpha chain
MTTENLDSLRDALLAEIKSAVELDTLEAIRVAALGKQGSVTGLLKGLGKAAPEDRKELGQSINNVKVAVNDAITARKEELEAGALDERLVAEAIDVTLPARPAQDGCIHPISQTIDEMLAIFCEMDSKSPKGLISKPTSIISRP